MPLNINELEVKPGDPVLPAWKKLLSWIRSAKVIAGPGIRLAFTSKGVIATVNREETPWRHPWRVSVGTHAIVSPGTVDGVMARMRDDLSQKLLRLDERDDDGKLTGDGPPRLKIDFKKHDDEGKFWIWLNADINEDLDLDTDNPEAVTITQERRERTFGQPLALVYLDESRTSVINTFQISHHNYKLMVQEQETGLPRRIFIPE